MQMNLNPISMGVFGDTVRAGGKGGGGGVYIIEFMASEGFDTLDDYSDMMKMK